MKKITPTSKITIALILINIIFFGVLYFWHTFMWQTVSEIIKKKTFLKEESTNIETLTNLKKQKLLAEETNIFFENISIHKDEIVSFIELLEEMGKKSDALIEIQTVNLEDSPKNEGTDLNSLKVILQVRGSWKEIANFILMIENNPHYLVIKDLKINTINEENNIIWLATISLNGIIN